MSVSQPYFWTGEVPRDNKTQLQACGGGGPYTSSRPGGEPWMRVGERAALQLARWITALQANASTAGVVSGFELVNEPALGFDGMSQQIRAYHDAVVPPVQAVFREAKLGVNVTLNFIGSNEARTS